MEENTLEKEYTGWRVWTPTYEESSSFYVDKKDPLGLKENEYLIIKDINDGQVNEIYKKQKDKMVKINRAGIKYGKEEGTKKNKVLNPRNTEQRCAFDLLSDTQTTIKLITGTWGTGKTFLMVAAALQAIKEGRFEKIIWIRNNVEVKDTKDMGALPGGVNDKLLPFLGPFIDHAGGKDAVMKMITNDELEVEPLQSLRGRNIENAIIMCSEAENLTREHLQLIIARAGEGSNVWLDGDTRQRDKLSFEKSKGLENMIDKLSGQPLFGYVKLIKSERSATAALADIL